MKLSAVILARVLAYVESFDLNPRGKVYYPDIVRALAERYNFQKFPQALEEFNEVIDTIKSISEEVKIYGVYKKGKTI